MSLEDKCTLTQQVYAELLQARVRLAEELNGRTKRKFVLFQKLFYKQGSKSGKILARALQARKAVSTIHRIHTTQDQPVVTSTEIATQFETYYSGLYRWFSKN